MIRCVLLLIALCFLIVPASAHDWYIGKNDPVTGGSCCTTTSGDAFGDCAPLKVERGVLEPLPDGYQLRLTLEQARKINPLRQTPVDTFIPEDRIQESGDGSFHVCIPPSQGGLKYDFYCFFKPNSM